VAEVGHVLAEPRHTLVKPGDFEVESVEALIDADESVAHRGEALPHFLTEPVQLFVHVTSPNTSDRTRQDVSGERRYSRVAVNGQIWLYAQ
jgi:hypothetical protein